MDTTNAGQPAQQEQQPQQQRDDSDVSSEKFTPQMWMECLERLRAAHDADESSTAGFLTYPQCLAAARGRSDVVQFLLDKGYDKDVSGADGHTPLRVAAIWGRSAVARTLLDAGADISLRCAKHLSALDYAIALGHVDVATLLIEYDTDVNAAPLDGNTPLHSAAAYGEAGTASLLLTKGAAVDPLDEYGCTPLSLAASEGHATATQVLLAAGADVTIRRFDTGMSALDRAAKKGHIDVLRAIVGHGVDVNATDGTGFTATHAAVLCDKATAIDVLAEAGAKMDRKTEEHGLTPIHVAAYFCRPAAILALLKHGASFSTRDATEQTPLHHATSKAGKLQAAEVVDLLLRHGADEKAIDRDGQTPADVVGSKVEEQDSLAEDVERVRKLLANAPADRAWRRRCFLVLCRAHYSDGRVQLEHRSSHAHDTGTAKRARSRTEPSRTEAEWAGVASMLMGVGADPISLMGDGADIIFQTIVGFL